MPSVTMDMTEYKTMCDARKLAEDEVVRLNAAVVEAALGDPGSQMRRMHELARDAISIVQYAMGTLGVQAKKWPIEKMYAIAGGLEEMIGVSPQDLELALELRHFARDAENFTETAARRAVIDEADRIETQRVIDAKNAALKASAAIVEVDKQFDGNDETTRTAHAAGLTSP